MNSRLAALLPARLLIGAAPEPPDVIASGQVLATLNDWRAIMYGAMVIIALLIFALLSMVAVMIGTIRKQATANAEIAVALRDLGSSYQGITATIARIEARLPLP